MATLVFVKCNTSIWVWIWISNFAKT